LQCVAVCCSVLQCVAVRCSALQCVAVRAYPACLCTHTHHTQKSIYNGIHQKCHAKRPWSSYVLEQVSPKHAYMDLYMYRHTCVHIRIHTYTYHISSQHMYICIHTNVCVCIYKYIYKYIRSTRTILQLLMKKKSSIWIADIASSIDLSMEWSNPKKRNLHTHNFPDTNPKKIKNLCIQIL